jgi:hypothetical protein
MNRNVAISNRLKEVLLDGTWIANTNVNKQLQDLNWLQATQKVGNLNTIAMLTFHLNYYLRGLIQAFETGNLEINDRYSFDMPEIKSASDWETLKQDFLSNANQFVLKVAQLEDNVFDQPFIDEKYGTWLRNIEGVIEHCYYHLGQISLIRKMIFGVGLNIKKV